MKVLTLLFSLVALSVSNPLAALAAAPLTSADADFLKNVQQDALGQYAIGSLAAGRAQNPRVKALAKAIAANATSANEALKKIASAHGVAPESKPTTRASYQYSNLSETSGPSFDQAFVGQIGTDASIAADTYADYAAHGSNAELRSLAKQQAAALKALAAQAQSIK